MTKTERRVFTPADILERARAGVPTTGLAEGRVAVETWDADDLDIRADGDGMSFRGYAAVFNSKSEDLGGFRETIRPGAFAKSVGEAKRAIKMFWNHNPDIALGSTRASLALTEDQRGLVAENRFPDTTAGRDMAVLVRDKIVDSMSFGFQTVRDEWSQDYTQRELVEVRLFEVSPVTGWPAYAKTTASVRDLAEQMGENPDAMAEAFRALREPDARLTDEQFRLLDTLIRSRYRRSPSAADDVIAAAFRAALS